jgi:hypothetical protein
MTDAFRWADDHYLLENAALAVESLFIEVQGHTPFQLYENGYADAIAKAAEVIRRMKPARPPGEYMS